MAFAPAQNVVSFAVFGHPEPAGSKRAVPTRRDWQRVPGVRWKVLDANREADGWKNVVTQVAAGEMLRRGLKPFEGPVYVSMTFMRARPLSHLKKNGELSLEGTRHPAPTTKPDLLKLARAVEDALTGVVYTDDALIVSERIRKEWRDQEGVHVDVMPL